MAIYDFSRYQLFAGNNAYQAVALSLELVLSHPAVTVILFTRA